MTPLPFPVLSTAGSPPLLSEPLHEPLPAPPADYEAFWRERYAQARAVPPAPDRRELAPRPDGTRVWMVSFSAWGGVRLRGWLTLPATGEPVCGIVSLHGYGGRTGPDDRPPQPQAAILYPCARGLSLSRMPGVPENAHEHVLHGIEHRDRYLHGGCVADVWAAVSALGELVPAVADRICYMGISFGGGIGAMALPWDARLRCGHLSLPSFGHHPLRLKTPCWGSGEAVRKLHAKRPEIAQTLAYYDAAVAARFIRVPMLIAAALRDPAVPPAGQWAIYDALPDLDKKRCFPLTAGHIPYSGEMAEWERLNTAVREWLAHALGL